MESEHFDTLTTRITAQLTRRRTLGILGALAAVGLGLADEAGAKKKKKNRRKHHSSTKPTKPVSPPACTGCTACQTCVNGVCQARPAGSACGTAGICINGFCARTCDPMGAACPGSADCQPRWNGEPSLCVPNAVQCDAWEMCSLDTTCDPGEACVAVTCLQGRCGPVIAG